MELWDVCDRWGNRTGETMVRGEKVPPGRYHQVCGILVEHVDGTFLMMKRHPCKHVWANAYEASCGGGVLAGESAHEAALRELSEETGIAARKMEPLYEEIGEAEQSIYHGYLCVTDWPKDQIVLQENETVAYRWASKKEIEEMMRIQPPVCIIQRGVQVYLGLLEDGQPNLTVFRKKRDKKSQGGY